MTQGFAADAMLDRVSRTFALSIRYLSPTIAPAVTRAYLLCRVADTIEDSPFDKIPLESKRELFERLAGQLRDDTIEGDWRGVFSNPETADEELVNQTNALLREFRTLSPDLQQSIVPWVVEMCEGMSEHVARWGLGGAEARGPESLEQLETYCYYVAGTVGLMLTEIFSASGDFSRRYDPHREELAKSFGLALQLTNVARDTWFDAHEGRWFVPTDICERHGLTQSSFFDPDNFAAAKAAIMELVERAENHVVTAHRYIRSLKRTRRHTRLFCLAPLNLAAATLRNLRTDERFPSRGHRSKITRGELKKILKFTSLLTMSNGISSYYTRSLLGTTS